MNRITEKFEKLKSIKKRAFIPYITVGFPDLNLTYDIVLKLVESGADIIELGVPFSDPLADGPTIQKSSQKALESGTNLIKVFELAEKLKNVVNIPLVLMSYYNPIYRYGIGRFISDLTNCQISGIIIPDLPPEEYGEIKHLADEHDIATIFLIAPNSTSERIRLVAKESSGFIYCVSVTGITGAKNELNKEINLLIRQIRLITNKPICVGFGISNKKQVMEVSKIADGVIVGSCLINLIFKEESNPSMLNILGNYTSDLAIETKVNL
ncbi:MAG: tryptophan synthase subunit alpha [bacterium]|nr:tryptophan synthase subunit alpha [bacterium]